MRNELLLVALPLLAVYAIFSRQYFAILIAAVLASTMVLPLALFSLGTAPLHVGISSGTLTLTTTALIIVSSALLLLLKLGNPIPLLFYPLAIYMAIAYLLVWQGTAEQTSGVFQYLLVGMTIGLGSACGAVAARNNLRMQTFSRILLIFAAVEFVVCMLQLAGIDVALAGKSLFQTTSETASSTGGRLHGTTDHPGTLGKMLFVLLIVALPMAYSRERGISRPAVGAIALMAAPLVIAEGRANFVAAIVLVVLWSLTLPGRGKINVRIAILAVLSVVAWLAYSAYSVRFAEDPNGGPRDRLLQVAYEQIPKQLWTGTGPNSWVSTVGRYDLLTSQGWPVHNSLLLIVGEIGIIGAILVVGPLLYFIGRCLTLAVGKRTNSNFARAILCAVPGFILIGWTGWGLLAGVVPVLASFIVSFAFSIAQVGSRDSSQPKKSYKSEDWPALAKISNP